MHGCCLILTNEFPTDDVLQGVLEPYYEYNTSYDERPIFRWDGWTVGGRYKGKFKLNVKKDDDEYRWGFYEKEKRAGRLFRSIALETVTGNGVHEEDLFTVMGMRDGFLYVDGGRIGDMQNFVKEALNSLIFIGLDRTVYAREYFDSAIHEWVDDEQYEEKVISAISDPIIAEAYACFVDFHW